MLNMESESPWKYPHLYLYDEPIRRICCFQRKLSSGVRIIPVSQKESKREKGEEAAGGRDEKGTN